MRHLWIGVLVAAVGFGCCAMAEDEGPAAGKKIAEEGAARAALEPGAGSAVERAPVEAAPDPCRTTETAASPNRPNWTTGTATTQCGVVESDFGWLWQPMGSGVVQEMLPASVRYGVTPRLQLRWGLSLGMTQNGGGTPALSGASDQWLSGMYRFVEQGPRAPALAFSYGFKIPTANPQKGFGSGYVDHQLTLIASRDVRWMHFDFNAVETLAGSAAGYGGAAQFGLALSVPVTKRLTGVVESDGGSQPGTPDRFGQALGGVSWVVRPSLVLDAGYTRAYTAGSPRQQFTAGFTYAQRPKNLVRASGYGLGRLLGK
ncbi:MAG: hypothetical protein WB622_09435 [Acidobacteriaceae bacterium]